MATPDERVRRLLGEVIPPDGSDADTMFTDDRIEDLLLEANNDIDQAALAGWREKAAGLAVLVDTAEGTSKRAMSDLHKNALAMVTAFGGEAGGGTSTPQTRSHLIERL